MLLTLIVIAAALLPAALLYLYINKQDAAQPEPKKWLWKAVRYGVYSALLVIVSVGPFTGDYLNLYGALNGSIANAFYSAAIPEEGAKLLMLWLLLRKNPYFDENMDGVVYAACVGLGFAGFENILYLFSNLNNFVSVAVTRAIFSVPGHFFFAIAMGYFVSLAHFQRKPAYYILAFLVPMLLHGIFDSILMVSDAIPQWSNILVIVFIVFCHYLRKGAINNIRKMQKKDNDIF